MPQLSLTKSNIEKLEPPLAGTDWYTDTKILGFQMAVGKTKKSWYVTGSLDGRNVRKRIGEYPAINVDDARKLAQRVRGQFSQGIDPRPKKSGTLEAVLESYIDYHSHPSRGGLADETIKEYRATINRHCSRWKERELKNIGTHEIVSLHKKLGDTPYAANRVVGLLRSLFRFENVELMLPQNMFYKEKRRQNQIDDLAAFYERVDAIEWPPKRALWLVACFTGIRRTALCTLEWSQVDFDNGTVYFAKMKNGASRTLPLSDQALALIKSMQGLDKTFVFPSRIAGRCISEPRDETVGVPFHNTRNTFTEAAMGCLLPMPVIAYLRGDLLSQTVIEGYVTRLDMDVMRDASNKIGSFLEERLMPKT